MGTVAIAFDGMRAYRFLHRAHAMEARNLMRRNTLTCASKGWSCQYWLGIVRAESAWEAFIFWMCQGGDGCIFAMIVV